MGIGIVLIFLAIAGGIASAIGSFVLRWIVLILTNGRPAANKLVQAVTVFPFACLLWAGSVFVFQAVVNAAFLHRDIGIGDGFDCPLPNGYALSFIDTIDWGTLYDPKDGSPWSFDPNKNVVHNLRVMQLAKGYVLGGTSDPFRRAEREEAPMDSYFLLDVRTGGRADFKSYDEFRVAALQRNIQPDLVPVGDFYLKYRWTWFDGFAAILLVGPPLIAALFLMRSTWRVRNGAVDSVTHSPASL